MHPRRKVSNKMRGLSEQLPLSKENEGARATMEEKWTTEEVHHCSCTLSSRVNSSQTSALLAVAVISRLE